MLMNFLKINLAFLEHVVILVTLSLILIVPQMELPFLSIGLQ